MQIFQPTFKDLLKRLKGSRRLFISAPWIAPSRAKGLADSLGASCALEIWLRMNPGETDKEELVQVFTQLTAFKDILIRRNPNLHWKAYLSDRFGFVGSANFTERGIPDDLSDDASLEALVKLTPLQLKQSWQFKKNLESKMAEKFRSAQEALSWWEKQKHEKRTKRYPDETPKSEIDGELRGLGPPRGTMR